MSETTNDANDVKPAEEAAPESAPQAAASVPREPVRLRIAPAIAIVVLHFAVLAFTLYLPTVIGNAIGIVGMPFLASLLLAVWWLAASRAPWRDRAIGVAAFVIVAVWIVISQQQYQARILSVALPVLTTGTVLILAATMRSRWESQRAKVLYFFIACAVLFPMFRIDDVAGNLAPNMSWRWRATPDELVVSSAKPGGSAAVPQKPGPQDWPAFRGPARDGVLRGVAINTDWNANPPKERWRKRVGLGFSSYAAIGNYLFTQEQRKDDEVVVCYEADTGNEVWINSLPVRFDEAVGSGPRATPTFEDGKLYTQGALGHLQCLDAATGSTIWKADIAADTEAGLPQWGFASSPLVTDKHVITFTGGKGDKAVIAYDKATGTKAWCGGATAPGYSSAHLATIQNVPQVVVTSGYGVQAFDPATGAILWGNEWKTNMNPRVVQPMVVDFGRGILVGTAEGKGTRYLQIAQSDSGWSATEKWTTRQFRPYFNDYVQHKGYCYGFDGDVLTCIDWATGYRRWKGPHFGGQLLLIENSDALIVLSEKGEVVLVKTNPSIYEEVAKFKAIEGKTWNHPVVANGKLFVRNAEEAACYDLPA
ncbi:MAG: PQQ-like beta-propeller repeat protein [Candidatus Hydrogenedentes bacterium]|nr:PQQ-like beta-propeller repeat protein [Candidatus Hydrogenedentota bacterium]